MLLESRKLAAISCCNKVSRSKLAAAALLLLLASKSSIANTEKKISSNINLAIAAQLTTVFSSNIQNCC
jgi:phage repressor protein C with HTH and peptisase S24 domain